MKYVWKMHIFQCRLAQVFVQREVTHCYCDGSILRIGRRRGRPHSLIGQDKTRIRGSDLNSKLVNLGRIFNPCFSDTKVLRVQSQIYKKRFDI
jgi:hypothetical protein